MDTVRGGSSPPSRTNTLGIDMKSAFGKIVGWDKSDSKSITPLSASNAIIEANRPCDASYVHRTGAFLTRRAISCLKQIEQIQKSRVKRGEQNKQHDVAIFRGGCEGR